MITKLSTKQLEEIIKIVINISDFYIDGYSASFDSELVFEEAKKEVTEYLQLPDLFNCE